MPEEKIRIAPLTEEERPLMGLLSLAQRKEVLLQAARLKMEGLLRESEQVAIQQERRRGTFAFVCIQEMQGHGMIEQYRNMVETFSLLIVRDHLFQALGYLYGQAKNQSPNAAWFLLKHCTQYLLQLEESPLSSEERNELQQEESIFHWSMHISQTVLLRVEDELEKCIQWLRLLAAKND